MKWEQNCLECITKSFINTNVLRRNFPYFVSIRELLHVWGRNNTRHHHLCSICVFGKIGTKTFLLRITIYRFFRLVPWGALIQISCWFGFHNILCYYIYFCKLNKQAKTRIKYSRRKVVRSQLVHLKLLKRNSENCLNGNNCFLATGINTFGKFSSEIL